MWILLTKKHGVTLLPETKKIHLPLVMTTHTAWPGKNVNRTDKLSGQYMTKWLQDGGGEKLCQQKVSLHICTIWTTAPQPDCTVDVNCTAPFIERTDSAKVEVRARTHYSAQWKSQIRGRDERIWKRQHAGLSILFFPVSQDQITIFPLFATKHSSVDSDQHITSSNQISEQHHHETMNCNIKVSYILDIVRTMDL